MPRKKGGRSAEEQTPVAAAGPAQKVAVDEHRESSRNAPRAEQDEAKKKQDREWAAKRRDRADAKIVVARLKAEAAATSVRRRQKARTGLVTRSVIVGNMLEDFKDEERSGESKLKVAGMELLCLEWRKKDDEYRAFVKSKEPIDWNDATKLFVVKNYRSRALMISDQSESGRNFRDNILDKKIKNATLFSGEVVKWNDQAQYRYDLIRNLEDLAAYYERLVKTGQDWFSRTPNADAAPTRPVDVPATVTEDRAVGIQAHQDACGQLVHEIMSNLDC